MFNKLRGTLAHWHSHLTHVLANRTVDVVLRLVAVISLAAVIFIAHEQSETQECFRDYAEKAAISTKARAEALEADLRAQDKLYRAIAENPRDSIRALQQYNQQRLVTDQRRQENPPPPPPSAACG